MTLMDFQLDIVKSLCCQEPMEQAEGGDEERDEREVRGGGDLMGVGEVPPESLHIPIAPKKDPMSRLTGGFMQVQYSTKSTLQYKHDISLQYSTLPYITLYYITVHYTTVHCIHYNTLHYITLHYIILHYITLYCIA